MNDDFVLLKGLADVSVSTRAAHLRYFSSNAILFLKRDGVFLTVTTRSVFPCMWRAVKMTEQQRTPDQLPAEKGQGGAGATYKVPYY